MPDSPPSQSSSRSGPSTGSARSGHSSTSDQSVEIERGAVHVDRPPSTPGSISTKSSSRWSRLYPPVAGTLVSPPAHLPFLEQLSPGSVAETRLDRSSAIEEENSIPIRRRSNRVAELSESEEISFRSMDLPDLVGEDFLLEIGELDVAAGYTERQWTPEGFHPRWYGGWYRGLPSRPECLASSLPHQKPSDWVRLLPPIAPQILIDGWRSRIVPAIVELADRHQLIWNSINMVRVSRNDGFGFEAELEAADAKASNIIWVCVGNSRIGPESAHHFVHEGIALLRDLGFDDIELELATSEVMGLANPTFLDGNDLFISRELQLPFMAGVGMEIARRSRPGAQGTAGVFINLEGLDHTFALTAQHVASSLPTDERSCREHGLGEPILLIGRDRFHERLQELASALDVAKMERFALGSASSDEESLPSPLSRKRGVANDTVDSLSRLYQELEDGWSDPNARTIAHVFCYPPFSVQTAGLAQHRPADAEKTEGLPAGYTEDWALIRLDPARFETTNLNVVLLDESCRKASKRVTAKQFPLDRHITVTGIAPLDSLSRRSLDVCKRGAATGFTAGTISPLESYVRQWEDASGGLVPGGWNTWELPIFSYDAARPFSKRGDSGACIVDGVGRVAGMMTRGLLRGDEQNTKGDVDITFVTPMEVIFARIREVTGRRATLA